MAITNYGTLKAAVASWLNRADLTASIPDFVKLAEQRIYYGGGEPFASQPLRIPAMQARTTGTISSGSISFPTDMLELQRISATVGGQSQELTYMPPQLFAEQANSASTPTAYTFANNAILTAGTGAADYTLDYFAKFSALSADEDTNWLITNAPAVYLYGALVETAPFLYDDPRFQTWFGMFKSSISALNRTTPRAAGGSLQSRVVM